MINKEKKYLKIPTEEIDVIKCECGKYIFIAHGKIEDYEVKDDMRKL